MLLLKPDPTFYPSAKLAMQAPVEGLAYVATVQRNGKPDALRVVDLDVHSPTYGQFVHTLELPYVGDELHHFGWNACSSALCPYAPHPYLERRYLIIPGLRSSRLYIVDTKPNPREPRLVKIIEPEEVKARAGYTRLHTVHCGPSGIYISALGAQDGGGPGGVFVLDHYDFQILGRWEVDRGPQFLGYDFWWHLGHDVAITSEWGPPELFENGLNLADVVNRRFGHSIHLWDLRRRTHLQQLDLGDDNQMVLELRPAHDPTKTYGFVGVVVNLQNLSSAIWLWHKEGEQWAIRKVIEVPAEPADPAVLPPMLKDLGCVPPLVTDINLSLDDRFLYVSCWGTGELRQYDVSDPLHARLTGSVRIGGLVNSTPHPKGGAVQGGPQMVEVSRDGRRIYFTNSLYSSWDDQFYPDMRGWMARVDANPAGGMALAADFFVDFGELRAHQVRLEGGDSSSDSFCYP